MSEEPTWMLTRLNTDRPAPFRSVVIAVWCTACKAEMLVREWPSHYRTRLHREARSAEARAAADRMDEVVG